MRNKMIVIIISVLLVGMIALFGFYYSLGIGLGSTIIKATDEIKAFEEELKEEEINLLDSIKNEIIEFADTTKVLD